MATTEFTRTQTAGTSTKKFTVSMWVKRGGDLGGYPTLFSCGTGSSDGFNLAFTNNDFLILEAYDGSANPKLETTRTFRDVGAWYHIVAVFDTDAAATDRMRFYVNGVEETSFTQDTNPSASYVIPGWSGSGDTMRIGYTTLSGSWTYFDGVMAHVHVCDGQAYAASDFGEFDSTSGIWVPNNSPSVTYGINGGFYKFVSGALTTDSSGESNTLTSVGTPTTTKDTPQNNFCTWNPNSKDPSETYTFSNGNTVCLIPSASGWSGTSGTLAAAGGKWYIEGYINYTPGAKNTTCGFTSTKLVGQNGCEGQIGFGDKGSLATGYGVSVGVYDTGDLLYSTDAAKDQNTGSWATAWAAGDYLMFAIDIDGGKFYFGANGTWDAGASNDPAAGTGGYTFVPGGELYTPITTIYQERLEMNFGNGYFSTTAIGSPNADANGEGAFKYAPPTGFYAMCTNNLKLYGGA